MILKQKHNGKFGRERHFHYFVLEPKKKLDRILYSGGLFLIPWCKFAAQVLDFTVPFFEKFGAQ